MYLMIQNPGVCPIEGFTILGVSSTRDEVLLADDNNDYDLLIGKFASGNKHAVNLLLRNHISPIVYCGKLCLEFYVKTKEMDDGLKVQSYGQVHCKISGEYQGKTKNQDKDLSFAVEYGIQDWDDLAMAGREFVSNAIDRTIREEKRFRPALDAGRLTVEVVADNQVRAKDGYTRVFIPYEPDIQKFYEELPKRFLHFSEPEILRDKVLTKRHRNINADALRTAVVYRKGVYIREVASAEPSLFDYNFTDRELKIDEARNVDDYRVQDAASTALRNSPSHILEKVFRALLRGDKFWESCFSHYSLSADSEYDSAKRENIKTQFSQAWTAAADGAVMLNQLPGVENPLQERLEKKGHKTRSVPINGWSASALNNGIRTAALVLSQHERNGIDILDTVTPAAQAAVDQVWSWIESVGLTNGMNKPPVKSFKMLGNAESETFGFYEDGTVHINEVHSNADVNKRLLQTVLDELTHHTTGSTDKSRDFQSFLMRMIVEKFCGEN